MIGKTSVEEALIGAAISHPNEVSLESLGVSPELFFDLDCKEIATAIIELEKTWTPIDLVTVKNKLGTSTLVSNDRLINIAYGIFSQFSVNNYVKELKSEKKRAEMIKIADEIKLMASSPSFKESTALEYANRIVDIGTEASDDYTMNVDKYAELMEYLAERNGKELFGFSFGENFKFLDEYTKGIQKGRTYRIGAPSNLGKTQLSYSFINALIDQWAKVAFFTLENDKNFTVTNLCANYQKVSSYDIEKGAVEVDSDYLSKLQNKFYLIDDCYDLGDIFSKVLSIKPDVVFLDYIGLVEIHKTDEDAKYTIYSKRVQQFVKRTKVSWIDLSNLPKWQEDADTIRTFGGFYGSSFLKNNADVCIHLYRNEDFSKFKSITYGTPTFDKIKNKAALNMMITKNRIGTARVETTYKVHFDKGGIMSEATEDDKKIWATSF